MVEAAFVAIRHDAHLKAIYERISTRRGTMKARVAVARRMLEGICTYWSPKNRTDDITRISSGGSTRRSGRIAGSAT